MSSIAINMESLKEKAGLDLRWFRAPKK